MSDYDPANPALSPTLIDSPNKDENPINLIRINAGFDSNDI
jgi:hypothetical protein